MATINSIFADGLHKIAYGLHNNPDGLQNIADGLHNIADYIALFGPSYWMSFSSGTNSGKIPVVQDEDPEGSPIVSEEEPENSRADLKETEYGP